MDGIKSMIEEPAGTGDTKLCELHEEKLECYCVSCCKAACSSCWSTLHTSTECSKCPLTEGLKNTIKDRSCTLSSLTTYFEGNIREGKSMLRSSSLTKFLMKKSLKSVAQDEESLTGMINTLETELERLKDIKGRASESRSLDSLLQSHDEVTNCQMSYFLRITRSFPAEDSCSELFKMCPGLLENVKMFLKRQFIICITVERDDTQLYGLFTIDRMNVQLNCFTKKRPLFAVVIPGDRWLDYTKKNASCVQLEMTYGMFISVIHIALLRFGSEDLHINSFLQFVLLRPIGAIVRKFKLTKFPYGFILNRSSDSNSSYSLDCVTRCRLNNPNHICACVRNTLLKDESQRSKIKGLPPNSLLMDVTSKEFLLVNNTSVRNIGEGFVEIGRFYIESSSGALKEGANFTAKVQLPF